MTDKDVDITVIMNEIKQKAVTKLNEDTINANLERIANQLTEIRECIIETYNYTKEREETAIVLTRETSRAKISQEFILLIKKCVRKLTRFIWHEQNEVNKSLNKNINALCMAQLELAKALSLMKYMNDRINNIADSPDEKRS